MRSYNSTGSREPIWTQVSRDPEDGLLISQGGSSTTSSKGDVEGVSFVSRTQKGLSVISAAVFIVGEMAGSGVLALPRAIANTGWIGIILLIIFCFNAGYGGTKLAACWDIIEERYSQHRGRTRNPYAIIGYHAIGKWGSILVSGSIQFTLFGAGTVYLLLSAQIIHELLSDLVPTTGPCIWFLLIAAFLTPPMWLGSPKDFSLVGFGAIMTTAVACVLLTLQIVRDGMAETVAPPQRKVHGFEDFFLSFGTLLFAFGGASTFPTIQNDMQNKKKFSTSILMAFIVILVLYLPVTVGGYFVYGDLVEPNISASVSKTTIVTAANVLMAVHLVLAFLIVINPVCQELEEIFDVPHRYHWKRCVLRSFIVFLMVFIGETVPKFGKILSLVGGSTITLLTFVFPPFFYMRLCTQKNPHYSERRVPLHEKVFMWELILIGLCGGSASTYSAIMAIFGPESFTTPCYWPSH